MLEKMDAFFEARLHTYDTHMLNDIESAREFYPFTADCLPKAEGCRLLDLGCGTGLELGYYFLVNPTAKVTGIDLSQGMLDALSAKFADKEISLICDSYFHAPLGENAFDAAVSVESLHHFTMKEKIPLYGKLCRALKADGYFILTDYFALSDEEENEHRRNLAALKKSQDIKDDELYHFDTPLTVEHEICALLEAGFTSVEVLRSWGATHTLCATKRSLLNITNGDYYNDYFLKKLGGPAIPFCEAMMDGTTVPRVDSDLFILRRAQELNVSVEEYRAKMHAQTALKNKNYAELRLWFGKDTFCQTNLLTLLAFLEEIDYGGSVRLNYIDDETFEVLEADVPTELGMYHSLYENLLISKCCPNDTGVLVREALERYLDYHSDYGVLARLVRKNSDKDDEALLYLLMEQSKAYGLSDRQAERLIKKYRSH